VLANTKALQKPSLERRRGADRRETAVREAPLLYVGGGILLADAATELRELAEHLQLPVAHTVMGKGALPDDHPLILGMTGFWGTKFINDKTRKADWILALGHAFLRGRLQLPGGGLHLPHAADKLIHIDIDPRRSAATTPSRSAPWPT